MNSINNIFSEKNIPKLKLIGRDCEIIYQTIKFKGVIINETKNTLQIKTENGKKIIPKEESQILITINNQKYKIDGKYIKGRHEDRIKHRMKRKW